MAVAKKKKLTPAETARKNALAVYAEAKSYRDGISSMFYGMGVTSEALVLQLRTTFKPSYDALESQFNTDRSNAETLPLDKTDWGLVANKAGEYRSFYSTLDEKMKAFVKLADSGSPTPPATVPTPPMPAGNQALTPGAALTPTTAVAEGDGDWESKLPYIAIGVAVVVAAVLVFRKGRGGLSGWSRMNPSLDWDATAEKAERMSVSSLRYAIADIKKTIPSSRKLDREDGGDREGWYMDEMSVYRNELKKRGL